MIDVFIRNWLPDDVVKKGFRAALSLACIYRWNLQCDARFYITDLPHMEAKRYAEQHATTDIYIVADDDCLILGADFVARGVDLMRQRPEYGILTAVSIIENYQDIYGVDSFLPVIERHAVGGVAFVRKGILTEFAACEPDHTDDTICAEMKRRGYKTGVMPSVQMNHIGYGFSLSSTGHWRA